MPDTTEKTKKAFIIRDFKDAGTDREFTASKGEDDTADLTEGEFLNFKHAGLVREPQATAPTKAPKTDA